MSRHRWWDSLEHSLEKEQAWFAEAGLDWSLDEELFRSSEVVVFRGDLRLGEKRSPGVVIYPPAYDAGEHPVVVAPGLEVGRHKAPNGSLCLDHPVLGELEPMSGAEAVERAERLWLLWDQDRDQLHEEEADAPDPWSNYVDYTAETAVVLELPDGVGERGYFELGVSSLAPFRGALVSFRETHPAPRELQLSSANAVLVGDRLVQGIWRRVDGPLPVPQSAAITNWVATEQREMVGRAMRYALGHSDPDMPGLLGFVYREEGPARGEFNDAWLFVVVRDGHPELARPFLLRPNERASRQPALTPLANKSIAICGVGALGSQVAALLARAGVGHLVLVDYDIVTTANRIRHELDLADVGRAKTLALADRVRRINPWIEVEERQHRLGHLGGGVLAKVQSFEDEVEDLVAGTDLIVNTTADTAAGYHLASLARQEARPLVHAWVSAGAWGARVLIQRDQPERSGCAECLARFQRDNEEGESAVAVPRVADDPAPQQVMDHGCANPTFTGPGFELTSAAAATTRIVVEGLQETSQPGYPLADFDLATLSFRSGGAAQTEALYSRLPVHPECTICNG